MSPVVCRSEVFTYVLVRKKKKTRNEKNECVTERKILNYKNDLKSAQRSRMIQADSTHK